MPQTPEEIYDKIEALTGIKVKKAYAEPFLDDNKEIKWRVFAAIDIENNFWDFRKCFGRN